MPALPASLRSPLPEAKAGLLAQLTEGLQMVELWWLSGYAAGLARERTPALIATPLPVAAPATALTIVYGSQTGNARRLAEHLAQQLRSQGHPLRLLRADAYPLRELKDERHLVVLISTQGDGDPPDDARGIIEHLFSKRAPKLPELRFAVLGLGDSSYPQFCAIGRRLDERLAELGATRWLARGDADLDIDRVATPWLAQLQELAKDALTPAPALATVTPLRPLGVPPARSREHPFAAELLLNQRISGRDSGKDVRHLELSLQGAGLGYEPGDALGLWPRNPSVLVQAVLDALRLDGDASVSQDGEELPLRRWLQERRELTRLSRAFLAAQAQRSGDGELARLLAPEQAEALQSRFAGQQLIDLLRGLPASWSGAELVAALRPLTPRLYSIASSMKAVGEEAHLSVAHVEYRRDGELRWGAASHLLADSTEGERLPVFVEANERFRLPQDGTRDLIMVGAGTGVAPYRGFLQERIATGASGRHWLFFGNPHARSDFLYQLEWQRALKQQQLQRLDLAFSRDGDAKRYVQHRLRERGRELYAWLQSGAHLYVCGAVAMGKDVHATLRDVIAEQRGGDLDAADEHLQELAQQGRYARDLY
jgi:sulfite reductase (NADPH) flavoprotein alpha-component